MAERVRKRALASGRFIVVQNSMSYETPRARIVVDRDRAAALGVQVSEIGTTLGALVGGAPISKFDRDNRSYDVVSQVAQEHRLNPERLGQYYVRAVERRHGAALGAGEDRDRGGARADRAVQSAELGDHLRAAAADRDHERGVADPARHRRRGDAGRLLRGLRRPVAARGAGGQLDRDARSGWRSSSSISCWRRSSKASAIRSSS